MKSKKLIVVIITIIIALLLSPTLIKTWNIQPTGGTFYSLIIYEVLIQELFIIFKKQNNNL